MPGLDFQQCCGHKRAAHLKCSSSICIKKEVLQRACGRVRQRQMQLCAQISRILFYLSKDCLQLLSQIPGRNVCLYHWA